MAADASPLKRYSAGIRTGVSCTPCGRVSRVSGSPWKAGRLKTAVSGCFPVSTRGGYARVFRGSMAGCRRKHSPERPALMKGRELPLRPKLARLWCCMVLCRITAQQTKVQSRVMPTPCMRSRQLRSTRRITGYRGGVTFRCASFFRPSTCST